MRIQWAPGTYSAGLSHGVLFGSSVVPWNGLKSVEETSSVSDTVTYFDGKAVSVAQASEGYKGTLRAFTYPDVLDVETTFGLSYRENGNLHLLYNVTAVPNATVRATSTAELSLADFAWELYAVPEDIPGYRPSSHLIIDRETIVPEVLVQIEEAIYGTDTTDPYLPTVDALLEFFQNASVFQIIDHGDGTWTAIGPSDVITMMDATTFNIVTPSAEYIDEDTYVISSW